MEAPSTLHSHEKNYHGQPHVFCSIMIIITIHNSSNNSSSNVVNSGGDDEHC